jgi:hypothetical protein
MTFDGEVINEYDKLEYVSHPRIERSGSLSKILHQRKIEKKKSLSFIELDNNFANFQSEMILHFNKDNNLTLIKLIDYTVRYIEKNKDEILKISIYPLYNNYKRHTCLYYIKRAYDTNDIKDNIIIDMIDYVADQLFPKVK